MRYIIKVNGQPVQGYKKHEFSMTERVNFFDSFDFSLANVTLNLPKDLYSVINLDAMNHIEVYDACNNLLVYGTGYKPVYNSYEQRIELEVVPALAELAKYENVFVENSLDTGTLMRALLSPHIKQPYTLGLFPTSGIQTAVNSTDVTNTSALIQNLCEVSQTGLAIRGNAVSAIEFPRAWPQQVMDVTKSPFLKSRPAAITPKVEYIYDKVTVSYFTHKGATAASISSGSGSREKLYDVPEPLYITGAQAERVAVLHHKIFNRQYWQCDNFECSSDLDLFVGDYIGFEDFVFMVYSKTMSEAQTVYGLIGVIKT